MSECGREGVEGVEEEEGGLTSLQLWPGKPEDSVEGGGEVVSRAEG